MFKRQPTTEERYMKEVVAPQQAKQDAHIAKQAKDARPGWRDRSTPAGQARMGYDEKHPKHPRNPDGRDRRNRG